MKISRFTVLERADIKRRKKILFCSILYQDRSIRINAAQPARRFYSMLTIAWPITRISEWASKSQNSTTIWSIIQQGPPSSVTSSSDRTTSFIRDLIAYCIAPGDPVSTFFCVSSRDQRFINVFIHDVRARIIRRHRESASLFSNVKRRR